MILEPSLEGLIRHNKASELRFNSSNIRIEEGFENFDDSIPLHSDSSIIGLYYKQNLAAILGFDRREREIHINQIQGRKGKKGYKPLASLEWERALIRSILIYGQISSINLFTATSSILETPQGCNTQDSLKLIERYDKPLREEGFSFNPENYLFEFRRKIYSLH